MGFALLLPRPLVTDEDIIVEAAIGRAFVSYGRSGHRQSPAARCLFSGAGASGHSFAYERLAPGRGGAVWNR
jgi:hypothetical protein